MKRLVFFGHVSRKRGFENLVVTGRLEGKRAIWSVRDWNIWIVCVFRQRTTWAQHSSSGLQRTECSGSAWSSALSTISRQH